MIEKRKLIFFFTLTVIFGCEKIGVDPNPPGPNPADDPRLKFKGVYNMTQLENGVNYIMTIDTLGPYCLGGGCSSLSYNNFGNLFTFNQVFYITNPDYILNYSSYNPITDKYGKRWAFSSFGLPYSPTHCNALYGDSIKICFSLNNILYYFEDGVPYQNLSLTHVGVRQ